MGISGPGTLANDLASAYLHRTVQELCKRIESWFASGDASLDEEGESKLVPTVEIIEAISRRYGGVLAPPVQTVERWRADYLKIFDAEIEATTEYVRARRTEVRRSFDLLLALCIPVDLTAKAQPPKSAPPSSRSRRPRTKSKKKRR
jgi:hypothetical protein